MDSQERTNLDSVIDHQQIDERDRDEILQEIDGLLSSNRLPSAGRLHDLKAQKKGAAFPLIINILAISAVLATVYFSDRLFARKQEDLNRETRSYQSAEGRILQELKKESEEKLKQKDQEIGVIQKELEELDRQSRELAESMEAQIAEREQQLRNDLEAELERERELLKQQGITEEDINARLSELERSRTEQYNAELDSFKNEAEAAIKEKEAELLRTRQMNEDLLAQINSEKDKIRTETRERETQLTARFEEEKAALAEEAAEAEARLEALTQNRNREGLIIDQINGTYDRIFRALSAGDTAGAVESIEALGSLVEDPANLAIEAVRKRNSVDRNIISLLRERIESVAYRESTESENLAAAAQAAINAKELADRGLQALAEGRTSEAEDLLKRSIAAIPAVGNASDALDRIRKDMETAELRSILARAAASESSGDIAAAAGQYLEAAAAASSGAPELLQQAVAGAERSMNVRLDRLSAEKDATEAGLNERFLAEKEASAARIAELEELYKAETGRLSGIIADRDKSISELEKTVEGIKQNLTSAETELAAAAETIRLREREIAEMGIRIAETEKTVTDLEKLIEDEQTRLLAEKAEAEKLKFDSGYERGYAGGYDDGRDSALDDILYYTDYISGISPDTDAQQRISKLSAAESRFGMAVAGISRIVASSAASGSTPVTASGSILIGSVSYATGNKLVIEPLTDTAVREGAEIIIKRKERGRGEQTITAGVVTSASEGRIEAETDTADTRRLDLVYMLSD